MFKKIAKLGPYLEFATQNYQDLRTYVVGELVRYDQVVDGVEGNMQTHLFLFIPEIDKLGLPENCSAVS